MCVCYIRLYKIKSHYKVHKTTRQYLRIAIIPDFATTFGFGEQLLLLLLFTLMIVLADDFEK